MVALPPSATALSPAAPPTDSVHGAHVALDADGRGLAVWAQYVASTDISTIEVAERRPDGSWRPPYRLAWTKGTYLRAPQVAVNGRGDAVVMWQRWHSATRESIDVATRPAGERWSAAYELAAPEIGPGLEAVAIGENGAALAAWGAFPGDTSSVMAAFRPPRGPWAAPQRISVPGRWLEAPSIAVGPDGQAAVAWGRGDVPYESVVQVVERPPDGDFGPPLSLSPAMVTPGSTAHEPATAIDPDGEVLVTWITAAGPNDSRVPVVAWRTRGSGWFGPLPIGPAESLEPYTEHPGHSNPPEPPRLQVGADGRAILLWQRRHGDGSATTLQWASRTGSEAWSAPPAVVAEPTSGGSHWADLATAPTGTAALWWRRESGYQWTPAAAAGGPGAAEAVPLPAVDLVGAPDLAIGGRGDSVVVVATRRPGDPGVLAATRPFDGRWSPIATLSTFAYASADAPAEPAACGRRPAPRRAPSRNARHARPSPARLLSENRRIARAAIRRAAAVTALLNRGLGPEHLRDGSFCAAAFAGEVWTAGGGTAGAVEPGKRVPMPAVWTARAKVARASATRLRADALLVETAMRRANALVARFDAGLTGADIRDGAIGSRELAAGLEIDGAVAGGAPPVRRAVVRPATNARVIAGRLIANRRTAQEALRRVDAVRERIAWGLTGADFRPGSIGLRDLAPTLRE